MDEITPSQGPGPTAPRETPDAPDKEKMEQIRRRRLEKLAGGLAQPSTTPPASESPGPSATPSIPAASPKTTPQTAPTEPAKLKINIRAVAPAPENPFNQLVNPQSESTLPVRPAEGALKRPRAESDSQGTTRPRKTVVGDEDIEAYENRILSQIFRITLDPKQKVDSSNHSLTYLANLRADLEGDNAPIRLTKEKLDAAIMEAATAVPHNRSVYDYLLPCWKRLLKAFKGLTGYVDQKDAILREAKRLCMSNCVFAAEVPELFSRNPNPATDSLTPYFLYESGEERGICPDFLTEIVSRFDDDMVKSMVLKAVAGLSYQLSSISMDDDQLKSYVMALKTLTHFPQIVTAIAEDRLFQIDGLSASLIETTTLLGPFFRISPLQPEVTKIYFDSPKTMDQRRISSAQEALRLTLQNHQRELLDITNRFIRAGQVSRNRTLDWFAHIVNSNHKRRAMQVDPRTVSSDGFMMNVTVVLDGLCEPFMDATFSKVSRIDIDYLRQEKPRVDIKDETKLNADQNNSDEFYAEKAEGTTNFISEVFFLTLAAHHYGSESTNSKLKTLDREIKHYTARVEEMEAQRIKFVNNPALMTQFETSLKPYVSALDKLMSLKYAIKGVLADKLMQTKSLLFMRYVTVWLLRVATNSDYTPEKTIQLPLSQDQPEAFKNLPEYVLEDIVSNFNFIFRTVPEIMISAVGDEIIALCITFLTNSEYIKNPYLKAKLVTLLFNGVWPVYHRAKGILGDQLSGLPFANEHLLHALMKFYIEVESTGAHTQFYDKFNIRYEIFQVVKCIWSNDVYKQRLKQESRINTDFFLRFVNLLLNDVTYVLDEALSKFPKIHDLQLELRQPDGVLSAEERSQKEEELATAEGQATSYMQLTNEQVAMMTLFTKNLSTSFTMPEIVDRVAAMVNYTLDTLVGPKAKNLKVENTEKYHFNAKTLLGEFIDIYLNLGVEKDFYGAIARDGRSYKPENYRSAVRIMEARSLKAPEVIQAWKELIAKFEIAKEIEDQEAADLENAPDEFMDPIMACLMTDPVILPVSKQTVDRATIQAHLLSDPSDPFNRTPLKIEDVISNVELKAQVLAWKGEILAKARAARDAVTSNIMDTSE